MRHLTDKWATAVAPATLTRLMKYGQIIKKKDPDGREYSILTLDGKAAIVLPDGQVSMTRAARRRAVRDFETRKKADRQAQQQDQNND